MVTYKRRLTLSDLLLQPEVIELLRERFSHIQNSLTTTIHEASELTNLSETQLRYAEVRGLLSPSRAMSDSDTEAPSRGQRRYTVENLLRAHLIAFILERGYSLSEISTFIENNVSIIHDLLETTSLRLRPVLDAADELLFKRFFVPRALYAALSLIFERDAIADAGIIFPVRATTGELQRVSPGEVVTADDLIHLGHILVAWRARSRPLATFITAGNPFEREQQVRLIPLSQFEHTASLPSSDSSDASDSSGLFTPPIHAYVAYSPQSEPELFQAGRQLDLRRERNRQSGQGARRLANPRTVAARLISYVQTRSCGDVAAIGQTETALSDALFYNAPELVNAALGDALLNQFTNTIVELGGMRMAPAGPAGPAEPAGPAKPAESRWRFACVLTPREPDASLKRQELVVRAQSKDGPHRIGVTTTSPRLNAGLTFRAFSSGRMAYRSEVDPLDPAVSYVSEESPIESALASPAIDGQGMEDGQPPAVLYIASAIQDAFSEDDFLLIRVLGRHVAEIVQTYNSRSQRPDTLTNTLDDPETVDNYFADFLSEMSFVADMQTILRRLADETSRQTPDEFGRGITSLTMIGLDVNDFSMIQRSHGAQVARLLTHEIGARVRQRINVGLTLGVPTTRLYRAWGDRFYLLICDEEPEKARFLAERIRQEVSVDYHLGTGSLPTAYGSRGSDDDLALGGIPIRMRLAGMTLTRDELRSQLRRAENNVVPCVARLNRLLEDGLKRANEAANKDKRSVWWNADLNDYEPTIPTSPSSRSRLKRA